MGSQVLGRHEYWGWRNSDGHYSCSSRRLQHRERWHGRRSGYAINNVLIYGKGGAAVAADKYYGIFTVPGTAFDTASETRVGGYAGVGVEFGIIPNLSVAGEYGHAFMGSNTVNFTATGLTAPVGTFSRSDRIQQDMDIFTVRVNYRFGGPVVARY